jgi:hypothetical protein
MYYTTSLILLDLQSLFMPNMIKSNYRKRFSSKPAYFMYGAYAVVGRKTHLLMLYMMSMINAYL